MIIGKQALCVLLATLLLPAAPSIAQAQGGYGAPAATSTDARPKNKDHDDKADAKALFPKATRAEPKAAPSRLSTRIGKLYDKLQANSNDEALAGAEEILADAKASNIDRAQAAYIAGYAAIGKNLADYSQASAFLQRAISENGLPNNVHYAAMLNLAQMQLSDGKYAEAQATAERFLAETGSEDAKAYAAAGNALYRLQRYPQAVAALQKALASSDQAIDTGNVVQMLVASYLEMKQPNAAVALAEQTAAKNPDDKKAQMLAANIYLQADQPEKASAVFERLRSKGLLTDSKDYQTGYRLLSNIDGRSKDTIALINEGLDKKILAPDEEVYVTLGQAYYDQEQIPQAIAAWNLAAPLAKDGETYLNVAKLQGQQQHWTDAKVAARQALDKGVQKPGQAWLEIARAEQGLGNKPATQTAFREAAKYPETRAEATRQLKQYGSK